MYLQRCPDDVPETAQAATMAPAAAPVVATEKSASSATTADALFSSTVAESTKDGVKAAPDERQSLKNETNRDGDKQQVI